jgi:hypothetical protein
MPDERESEDQKHNTDASPIPIDQSVSPSSASDHISSNGTKPTEQNQRPTEYDFRKWSLIFTGALVVIGAIYSFFSCQQWLAMRQQATELSLDERAWVSTTNVSGKPQVGSPVKLIIAYRNTGKTPAFAVTMQAKAELFKGPINAFDFAENIRNIPKMESVPLLAPGVEWYSFETLSGSQDQIDGAATGEWNLVIFGKIAYNDVFKCPHWTTFAFHFDAKKAVYIATSKFNDADHTECP